MSQPSQPIKIVACTFSRGAGNGIAVMDEALFRSIDRERFDLTFCHTALTNEASQMQGLRKADGQGGDYLVRVDLADRFEALRDMFAGADVVQFNGGMDPVACDAALAARVPSVVEVMHVCEPGQRMPNISTTVCVSDAVREWQPDPSRTHVIPNGVDTDRFQPPADRPADRFVILQVGQRSKGMHFHIDDLADELLAMGPDVELWLAGDGQSPDANPDAERHGNRIKYLGVVRDMPALYAQADVMALASQRDAYGLACAEAMACGCVPVVSGDGGMAAIVRHGVDGWLVDCERKDEFLVAMGHAYKAKAVGTLSSMAERGRQRVVDDFSLRRCVRGYEDLYLELVLANGRHSGQGWDPAVRHSAESMLIQLLFRLSAGAGLDQVLDEWLRHAENRPQFPCLLHPEERFWQSSKEQAQTIFRLMTKFGMPQVEAALNAHLAAMYRRAA